MLCHLCNAMIGCAREDPAILLAGAAYLRAEAPSAAVSAPSRDVIQAVR